MTLDQAVMQALEKLEPQLEAALQASEEALRRCGLSDAEFAAALATYKLHLVEYRAKAAAGLRRELAPSMAFPECAGTA